MGMQPDLDPAWTALRDELVAAGALADGTNVLLRRANRAVVIASTTIAGRPTILVLAPIARAADCDADRALVLAKDLELGAIIVVGGMVALRHVMASTTTSTAILDVATHLAHSAALLAPALIDRTRTRSTEVTTAFAHCAE